MCLSISEIADLVPSEIYPRESIKILFNIKLADPNFHLPRLVDLLIGAGTTLWMFSIGQINLSQQNSDLYLQKTRLGWVVAGGTVLQNRSRKVACQLASLERQIAEFWRVEEVAVDVPGSSEEVECEAHYIKNVTRHHNGRYVVRLSGHPVVRYIHFAVEINVSGFANRGT